jgi:hypothetical protein
MSRNKTTMLIAGLPLERGKPEHIEHNDQTAVTNFDIKTGIVIDVHTPQETLVRIHELMHARFSSVKRQLRQYKNIRNDVRNIVEDCRIHLKAWPWRTCNGTPQSIVKDCLLFLQNETAKANVMKMRGELFPEFAIRLRAAAVRTGIYRTWPTSEMHRVGFSASEPQWRLAETCFSLIQHNKEGIAAKLIQEAFFPPIEIPPLKLPPGRTTKKRGKTPVERNGEPSMEIIELPHNESIESATIGYRVSTSGSRLHRPALRRPVLPQRLFVRRSIQEPGGTILIDASGSMGEWSQVSDWCKKAPFATVAYYAGNSRKGWLYVYARDGFRASKIEKPPSGGNTVDGPAITWLMQQPGPRTMITDRQFCGASDSTAQIMRLAVLEQQGEITVLDYSKE